MTIMNEFRCSECNRLLAKSKGGLLQIKCPRCGVINEKGESHEMTGTPQGTEVVEFVRCSFEGMRHALLMEKLGHSGDVQSPLPKIEWSEKSLDEVLAISGRECRLGMGWDWREDRGKVFNLAKELATAIAEMIFGDAPYNLTYSFPELGHEYRPTEFKHYLMAKWAVSPTE